MFALLNAGFHLSKDTLKLTATLGCKNEGETEKNQLVA